MDQAPRTDPEGHWDRLLRALTDRTGPVGCRPPAGDADLARLEAAFGHPVPEALRVGEDEDDHEDDHDHLAAGCYLTHSDDPEHDLISNLDDWCTVRPEAQT